MPRGIVWSKKKDFHRSDYCLLFGKESNPIYDLRPTLAERRCDWYTDFLEFFIQYIPRTSPVRQSSMFEDYLQQLYATRKRGTIERKYLPIVRSNERSIIEISIIQDGVITELNARIMKLEAIIQVLARERNGEVANFCLQKKLVFDDVLCNLSDDFCDELNHVFLELCESTIFLNGSASLELRSDDDYANEYIVQEELRLRFEEKEKVLLKEQKMKEKDNRLRIENENMLRLEEEKRLEHETNYKKRGEAIKNSDHMKKAMGRILPVKRSQGTNDASIYCWGKKHTTGAKIRNCYGIHEPDMTEKLKDVTPWIEDLKRPYSNMNMVHFTEAFDLFLGKPSKLTCKFPWCNDVSVDRTFWESLVCLDPRRKGWLMDEHIELWVNYMWHVRPANADWAMVSGYFVQLLLQKTRALWYVNGERYVIPWCDVNQVFIPINETDKHWFLAHFNITTGVVTFYDSGETFEEEWRDWYVNLRQCLEVQLPYVLDEARVFEKKGINPSTYSITFRNADNVPKQGGLW